MFHRLIEVVSLGTVANSAQGDYFEEDQELWFLFLLFIE
jgi:hypothetical protein